MSGANILSRYPVRGVERREFIAPSTGRTINQLTGGSEFESKHGYYDVCPWSSDGTMLAFASAKPEDLTGTFRDNVCTDRGQLCVMDTASSEVHVVAPKAFYTSHTGAWPMWRDRAIVSFLRIEGQTAVLDLASGQVEDAPQFRQLSPDGQWGVSDGGVGRPDDVDVMDVATGARASVASKASLYELTPNRDQFSLDDMTLGNMKWSPDSSRILVAMWVKPHPTVRRSLYIVERDGSQCRWLGHMAHHHSWSPDGRSILFNDHTAWDEHGKGRESRMHLVDADGGKRRVVINEPLGSHPLMSPGGQVIADSDRTGVFLVHVAEQRVEWLAKFRQPFKQSHRDTHPHCVFSPNGSQLLYNSAETGRSELYLIDLPR